MSRFASQFASSSRGSLLEQFGEPVVWINRSTGERTPLAAIWTDEQQGGEQRGPQVVTNAKRATLQFSADDLTPTPEAEVQRGEDADSIWSVDRRPFRLAGRMYEVQIVRKPQTSANSRRSEGR